MLSTKKLLYKTLEAIKTLQGKTNFRRVEATSVSTTIAANNASWLDVSAPSSAKAISIIGWYVNGASTVFPYSITLTDQGVARFAMKNVSSSSVTFTLTVRFLAIDN